MGYAENNLGKNEKIIKVADRNGLFLLSTWIKGILFCWLLLIPFFKAIIKTVQFNNIELALTNKRLIGKTGVVNTEAMDSMLNKVQNVKVTQSLGGKIFNYSDIVVTTAAGSYKFGAIKNGNQFKNMVTAQIDQFEEDRIKQQADEMAKSMAGVLNAGKQNGRRPKASYGGDKQKGAYSFIPRNSRVLLSSRRHPHNHRER